MIPWYKTHLKSLVNAIKSIQEPTRAIVTDNKVTLQFDTKRPIHPRVITTWRRFTQHQGVSSLGTDKKAGVFEACVFDKRTLPDVGTTIAYRNPPRKKTRVDKIMTGTVKRVDPNGVIWVYRYNENDVVDVFVTDIAEYRAKNGDVIYPSTVIPSHNQVAAFLKSGGLAGRI